MLTLPLTHNVWFCGFVLAAKQALTCRLSRNDSGRLVSVLDLPGDVLIVPQATLGGKLKGKAMQYHNNIDKDKGLELYEHFVETCRRLLDESACAKERGCVVRCGTYGNLQVLQLNTNGPFTHVLEL